jgi:hypothetical protein
MKFDSLVKEIIAESLDNPYPFKHSEKLNGYVFYPDPNNQNVYYVVYANEDPDYRARLTFIFDYTNLDKGVEGSTEMMNFSREELKALNISISRVISTVAAIIVSYLSTKQGPDKKQRLDKYTIILYEGKNAESGRISLYDSLALKLLNFLGEDNWEYDKFVGRTGTTFEFSRKFA